ncbi:hypothetical protein CROQUDRAFT_132808 [Cronartium quercuum f. sp. fusiforme G11]|uniref:Uncharacterized protein n=1 Tax=Cronartium quercuum f. sp. fusiforme G11 TaxID=708437 RepID=A0A9P6NHE3_9BASI|nr:hypothetical protein CROQUDRAFT_132808 [Cronartium quercuum f. sp. fusiforme G11]
MAPSFKKIFDRRVSNASTSTNSSGSSFHCQGIPDDFYSEIYDSPEERAKAAHLEEVRRRAVYNGYDHVQRNVLPDPPNYYSPPPLTPTLPRTPNSSALKSQSKMQTAQSLHLESRDRRVHFFESSNSRSVTPKPGSSIFPHERQSRTPYSSPSGYRPHHHTTRPYQGAVAKNSHSTSHFLRGARSAFCVRDLKVLPPLPRSKPRGT